MVEEDDLEDQGDTTTPAIEETKDLPQILQQDPMEEYIRSNAWKLKVLNLGCGNSILPEEMHDVDGYRGIMNVDISPVCINAMFERNHEPRPTLQCKNLSLYINSSLYFQGKSWTVGTWNFKTRHLT